MFLDCLEMIFSSLESVVSALDVDLFTVGTVGISLWELILGLLVLGIIFGFFLAPRSGSGLAGIGNLNRAEKARYNNSYKAYEEKRFRNEQYSNRYNGEMGADF